jgi:two-component system cell cycle sensor histidine kinase/response regulator CckA
MLPAIPPDEELEHSDRLEIMTRHTAGAAHDMASLVTIILGYGELIRRATVPGSKAHMNVNPIVQSAKEIGVITSRILAFCAGRIAIREEVNLAAFFADHEVTFRDLLLNRVDLVIHCQGVASVLVDPSYLFRVFSNLLVNARAATDAVAKPRIEISAQQTHAGEVVIAFADNGAGMSEEVRTAILHGICVSTKRGHTGLGTGVMRSSIIEAGGRMDIESEPGVGTTFFIWLPAVMHETGTISVAA